MKNWIVLGLGCVATVAFASMELKNIPEPLNQSLRLHGTKSATMEAGLLRVVMRQPTLTELTYYNFIYHGICAEQWRTPEKFAQIGLKRVEVLDAAGVAGFAFDGDATTCADMGQMGKNFRTFVDRYTAKCEAGRCGTASKK